MTEAIQTRWYRSPEVILLEKNYDQSIDIWSLGVSIAELIFTSSKKSEESKLKDRFLFKGKSCFPISPEIAGQDSVDFND